MKHLQALALLILLTWVGACTQTGGDKTAPVSELAPAKPKSRFAAAIAEGKVSWPEISADSAGVAATRWMANGPSAIGSGSSLLRGFVVPKTDLEDILSEIATDTTIFAQMGIHYAYGPAEVSLIFRVKDAAGAYHFYDFSRPCPPVCPPN